MKNKSVIAEAQNIQVAIELIQLGARQQVLEQETNLSRERLLRLYKEVKGVSPPKGMLPFSTDWFLMWRPNVHSSLFASYYFFLERESSMHSSLERLIKAFHIYLSQVHKSGLEPVLTITRAWTMIRFFEAGLLQMTTCSKCNGDFVTHSSEFVRSYACGLCEMPARAGLGAAKSKD